MVQAGLGVVVGRVALGLGLPLHAWARVGDVADTVTGRGACGETVVFRTLRMVPLLHLG